MYIQLFQKKSCIKLTAMFIQFTNETRIIKISEMIISALYNYTDPTYATPDDELTNLSLEALELVQKEKSVLLNILNYIPMLKLMLILKDKKEKLKELKWQYRLRNSC